MPNDVPEELKHLEDLYPLREIAELIGVKSNTLHRWSDRSRKIDFPEPKRSIGRYQLYSLQEVHEWVFLWKRVSQGMGNGDLNGKRTNS